MKGCLKGVGFPDHLSPFHTFSCGQSVALPWYTTAHKPSGKKKQLLLKTGWEVSGNHRVKINVEVLPYHRLPSPHSSQNSGNQDITYKVFLGETDQPKDLKASISRWPQGDEQDCHFPHGISTQDKVRKSLGPSSPSQNATTSLVVHSDTRHNQGLPYIWGQPLSWKTIRSNNVERKTPR